MLKVPTLIQIYLLILLHDVMQKIYIHMSEELREHMQNILTVLQRDLSKKLVTCFV